MIIWKDEETRFGIVSVALHWINAAAVITLLTIGLTLWPMPRDAERSSLLYLHMSVAVLAFPFIVARVVWRLRHGKPRSVVQSRGLELAAEVTWRVLLCAIVLQFITGPLIVLLHGHAIEVFGMVVVPTPFSRAALAYAGLAVIMHDIVAVTLALFLATHILGALKHLLYDRDYTLQRMVWPSSKRFVDVAGDQELASGPGAEDRDVERVS